MLVTVKGTANYRPVQIRLNRENVTTSRTVFLSAVILWENSYQHSSSTDADL